MKYLIALLLCLGMVGVAGAEESIYLDYNAEECVTDPDALFKTPDPVIYVCEKCGRETEYPWQFGTEKEVGLYCPYCMKELADKYLPKIKEK